MFQPNTALLPHVYNNTYLAVVILLTIKKEHNNVLKKEIKFMKRMCLICEKNNHQSGF